MSKWEKFTQALETSDFAGAQEVTPEVESSLLLTMRFAVPTMAVRYPSFGRIVVDSTAPPKRNVL